MSWIMSWKHQRRFLGPEHPATNRQIGLEAAPPADSKAANIPMAPWRCLGHFGVIEAMDDALRLLKTILGLCTAWLSPQWKARCSNSSIENYRFSQVSLSKESDPFWWINDSITYTVVIIHTYIHEHLIFPSHLNPNLLRMRLASIDCLVEGSEGLRSAAAAEFASQAQGHWFTSFMAVLLRIASSRFGTVESLVASSSQTLEIERCVGIGWWVHVNSKNCWVFLGRNSTLGCKFETHHGCWLLWCFTVNQVWSGSFDDVGISRTWRQLWNHRSLHWAGSW